MLIESASILAQSTVESESSSVNIPLIIVLIISVIVVGIYLNKAKSIAKNKGLDGELGIKGSEATVTSQSVASKRFTPTKFSEGYDQDEVDDFLDTVTQELKRLESGIESASIPTTTPILTPKDVVIKHFQPTKFREGYDQDQVDDYLDEIVVALRYLAAENERLQNEKPSTEASTDI